MMQPRMRKTDCHGITTQQPTTVSSTKRPRLLRRDKLLSDGVTSQQEEEYHAAGINTSVGPADVADDTDTFCEANAELNANAEQNPAIVFNNVLVTPATAPGPITTSAIHSVNQKWTVSLLKMLNDMNAPDYAFRNIIQWGYAAQAEGYTFQPPGGINRNSNIALIYDSLHNAEKLRPSVRTVLCPPMDPSDVIIFEFAPQLLYLLQNPTIMTSTNLILDPLEPLKRFVPSHGHLGEACSGTVYRNAYDRLITDPTKELFVPIIQWIDRTSITGNDRFSLKPYMFTPAIFTEEFRRTIHAWGYHGFLPKNKVSSAQNATQRQGENIRRYHAQLSAVLESFQLSGPLLRDVTLPLGPTGSMSVDIVTCILFVIQDMQEGDMLCGRFGPHTSQIQRQCRACNIDYFSLDNPHVQCRYLYADPMNLIACSPDTNLRQRWSQHKLDNAFQHVEFGDPTRGIFGATPVETMHGYRKGMIEVVTFMVLENVPTSKKAALDQLAVAFHKSHRQTHRKAFPATDFSNGITNLTKISAAERVGLVFLFVILVQYDSGWAIVSAALSKHKTDLADILELFEAMLCFDAWLNKPLFWPLDQTAEAKATLNVSIQELMAMCATRIPSNKINAWNFPKFHELLHLADDMERFGAPINFSAQRPESLLIPAAKLPGRRAQKRHEGSLYEIQSAQRLADTHIINIMHDKIFEENQTCDDVIQSTARDTLTSVADTSISQSTGRATFAVITRHNRTSFHVSWSSTTNVTKLNLPVALLTFLCDTFGDTVRCATEYVREQYTFRCHPCYQSDGPIYDWMKVMFDGQPPTSYPCRLAIVVVMDNPTDPYQLVVQSATERTYRDSTLLTEWTFAPDYYVISPDSIEGPCFVIMISPTGDTILETLPYEAWPSKFTED
jgi:Plavaka transposase